MNFYNVVLLQIYPVQIFLSKIYFHLLIFIKINNYFNKIQGKRKKKNLLIDLWIWKSICDQFLLKRIFIRVCGKISNFDGLLLNIISFISIGKFA